MNMEVRKLWEVCDGIHSFFPTTQSALASTAYNQYFSRRGPDLYQNARNMRGTCSDLTDTLNRIDTTSLIKADFILIRKTKVPKR